MSGIPDDAIRDLFLFFPMLVIVNNNAVQLMPLSHRGDYCISIRGHFNDQADSIVRGFPGRKYSKTQGCWYVPYSVETLHELCKRLSSVCVLQVDKAFEASDIGSKAPVNSPAERSVQLPDGYHEALVSIRYSPATVKGYESQFKLFLEHIHPKGVDEIDDATIKKYLYFLADERRVSGSTQNQAINAIKFYLERVRRQDRATYYIDRPVKENKLPTVLSKEEITRLLQGTNNLKHRCILQVLYSGGLRISELLRLAWVDIDIDRQVININGGKGAKDRITLLSPYMLRMLEQYKDLYKPNRLIFENYPT